jgi:hypothetical protein
VIAETLRSTSLRLSGLDATMFEIDDRAVYLRAGADLDSAANPVLDLTVVADGESGDASADLAIDVTNVNDPPHVALEDPVSGLSEDTDTADGVKVADILIQDDGLGDNVLSMCGRSA